MAVPAKHGLRSHQDQMAQGWRLYRRWRSGPQLGWPRLTAEIQELIATMASEEPALGHSVSAASFSSSASWSVLARSAASVGVALRDRPARAGEPSSPTMLRRSGPPTSSSSRPSPSRRSYVIFFISHGSRQLLHYEVPVPSSSLRRLRRGRAPLSPIIQALLLILA